MTITICSHGNLFTAMTLDLHIQLGTSRTTRMKRGKAILAITLDTSTFSLFADITNEFPSRFGNKFDVLNRFHVDWIRNGDFRDPESAERMNPFGSCCLLECSVFDWTQETRLPKSVIKSSRSKGIPRGSLN